MPTWTPEEAPAGHESRWSDGVSDSESPQAVGGVHDWSAHYLKSLRRQSGQIAVRLDCLVALASRYRAPIKSQKALVHLLRVVLAAGIPSVRIMELFEISQAVGG
jgi:hypothetical protein